MTNIGTFTKADNGFTGTVKTLTLNVKAKLVPADGGSESAPDYRVYAGNVEIGAAWKKTSENGRDYVSLKLDDPSLPQPIYASLFQGEDPDTYNLLWSRPRSS